MILEPRRVAERVASQKVGGSAIIRRISQRTSSLRFESGVANAAEPRPRAAPSPTLPKLDVNLVCVRPRPDATSTFLRFVSRAAATAALKFSLCRGTTAAVAVGPRPPAPLFSLDDKNASRFHAS